MRGWFVGGRHVSRGFVAALGLCAALGACGGDGKPGVRAGGAAGSPTTGGRGGAAGSAGIGGASAGVAGQPEPSGGEAGSEGDPEGGSAGTGGRGGRGGAGGLGANGGGAPEGGEGGEAGTPEPGDLRFDVPVDGLPLAGGFVLTEDLTGDGRREAVFLDPWTTAGSLQVTFARDLGDGSFAELAPIVVPGSDVQLVFGDFDGDGTKDVVLPDRDEGNSIFRVHMGNGDATFSPSVEFPRGMLGDFNGDGRTDAFDVRGTNVSASIMNLADENGGFVASDVPLLTNASVVVAGDFDGDDNLDVAFDLDVHRGLGDGTFGSVQPVICSPCGDLRIPELVADLNDDGRDDIVAGYPNEIVVLLADPDGTLRETSRHAFRAATHLAAGDIDGDGDLDVVANTSTYLLELFYGDGAGNFEERRPYDSTHVNTEVPAMLEDRDGDGLIDVVIDARWVALGRGDRRIRAPEYSAVDPVGSNSPFLVDFQNDGLLELVSVISDARINVVPFGTNRYLGPSQICDGPGTGIYRRVADYTGDGVPDVISFAGDLNLWVGTGTCDFEAATPHAFSGNWFWPVAIDGDALTDLVFWRTGSLGITLATGPGTFATPVLSPYTGTVSSLAPADLNDDGHLDVVVANFEASRIAVMLGDAGLALAEVASLTLSDEEETYLEAVDIDGDGDQDIVMGVSGLSPGIDLLRNDGAGNLTRERLSPADTSAQFSIADADGDGILELLVAETQARLGIHRVGPSGPAVPLARLSMPRGSRLFDVDGDGDRDLVHFGNGFVGVANNLIFD